MLPIFRHLNNSNLGNSSQDLPLSPKEVDAHSTSVHIPLFVEFMCEMHVSPISKIIGAIVLSVLKIVKNVAISISGKKTAANSRL